MYKNSVSCSQMGSSLLRTKWADWCLKAQREKTTRGPHTTHSEPDVAEKIYPKVALTVAHSAFKEPDNSTSNMVTEMARLGFTNPPVYSTIIFKLILMLSLYNK